MGEETEGKEMTAKTQFAGANPWAALHKATHATKAPSPEKNPTPTKKPVEAVKKLPPVPKLMANGKPRKPPMPIKPGMPDPAEMSITDDKPTMKRVMAPSKYEAMFSALGVGQSIKCKPEHVAAVANALRAWIKARKLGWKTAVTMDYGDGLGRVFRVEKK